MSGYIGATPVPQATQSRQSFTATASQTSFATAGYSAGFLDVYLNGVHLLDSADYTATNGSDIVLTVGAAAGDVLEVVSYSTFEVLDPTFTGTTTVDVLSVTGAATGTDLTLSGGVKGLFFTKAGQAGIKIGAVAVNPCDSAGADLDNYADLGATSNRWKDAYLSGGVYLGGTGAANKLDDYEEGTWTPTIVGSATAGVGSYNTYRNGHYTKVGNLVSTSFIVGLNSHSGSGSMQMQGLPFAVTSLYNNYFAPVTFGEYTLGVPAGTQLTANVYYGSTGIVFQYVANGASNSIVTQLPLDPTFSYVIGSLTYRTDA
jgi:hypothetical protein